MVNSNDKDPIYSPLNPSNPDEKTESFTKNSETDYERGQHPNSLKNIQKHQFKKGVSGNIMGRKPTFESYYVRQYVQLKLSQ